MKLLEITYVFVLLVYVDSQKQYSTRSYECIPGNRCRRSPGPVDNPVDLSQHPSLQACRLVCSSGAGLWPLPTGPITTGSNYIAINPGQFHFLSVGQLSESARIFMASAIDVFIQNVRSNCGIECKQSGRKVVVNLKVESSNIELDWDTNEGYDLEILTRDSEVSVFVVASTVYGARHGLETLSQLVAPIREPGEIVILDSASIHDKPVFQHRGLLIDTARNFLSVRDILRTIDALASVKMNVLHWHATDSQSFPLEIKSEPLMAKYGAYGPDKIYTVEDMHNINKYAKSRGVRIILEVDSPSHAGAGWEWGESQGLGKLAVCVNQQPWRDYCIQPPCGQLNPVNPNTFTILKNIYIDLLKIFGRNGIMHLGGDELFVNCWNATLEVTERMSEMGLGRSTEDFLKLWANVHNKQLEILNSNNVDKATDKAIVWSSMLTSPEFIENYLNKSNFIVQTWVEADSNLIKQLLTLGYKLIISTKDAWYLDHGFWGVTKYHTWRDAYNNRIPQNTGVLGGEACMWGEYVSNENLDSRVWPRTAAVAERLWTDSSKITTVEAEPRLQAQIMRLKSRKISPDAISPEWCNQNEGQCL